MVRLGKAAAIVQVSLKRITHVLNFDPRVYFIYMSAQNLADVAPTVFTVDVCIVSGDDVLMFKRSPDKKVFPGWLALPGGHIEVGEDPLAAAIREVKEETGVEVSTSNIQLKFVALHHHIDRNELFVVFGYKVMLPGKPEVVSQNWEGKTEWVSKETLLNSHEVFPPVQYYSSHLIHSKAGILYNYSIWNNATLVRVVSEHLDKNT